MSTDLPEIPNRPDPREAPALYRRHGMAVDLQTFLARRADDDRPCGCYVGALLVEAAGGFDPAQAARDGSTFNALARLSGLPRDYVVGLVRGFSPDPLDCPGGTRYDRDRAYLAGIADGQAAFAALREAGMVA